MYQKLIIYFLFYFVGLVFSPLLASDVLPATAHSLLTLSDDLFEYDGDLEAIFRNISEFEGNDYPVFAFNQRSNSGKNALNKVGQTTVSESPERAAQRPLFLLFHAWLLYDRA